jgi:hypothetical protein
MELLLSPLKKEEGKTKVNFSSSVTMSEVNKYPELSISMERRIWIYLLEFLKYEC